MSKPKEIEYHGMTLGFSRGEKIMKNFEFKRILMEQDDLEEGIPGDVHMCPVARAVSRMYEDELRVSVGLSTMKLYKGREFIEFNLPTEASEFISEFDEGSDLEPIEFDLTEDDVVKRKGEVN